MLCALILFATVPVFGAEDATGAGSDSAATDDPTGRQAVIPPGQDEVLGKMLGLGSTPIAQCQFANANVERSFITTTYNCPQGEVIVDLYHPSVAPAGASKTAQFAVLVQKGTPPDEFLEALLVRVRTHEDGVKWTWIGTDAVTGLGLWRVPVLAALALIGAVFWWVRRRYGSSSVEVG